MSKTDQENFIINLTDFAESHEDWLRIVCFGMGMLLQDQLLLVEVIFRRAERLQRETSLHKNTPDFVVQIFQELGLRLEAQS